MLQVRGAENHPKFSLGVREGEGNLDIVRVYEESLVLRLLFRSRLRTFD